MPFLQQAGAASTLVLRTPVFTGLRRKILPWKTDVIRNSRATHCYTVLCLAASVGLTLGLIGRECGVRGRLRLTHTASEYCRNIGRKYRSTMTLEHSIQHPLTLCAVDFHVRTSAKQMETPKESQVNEVDYGVSTSESFAIFDRDLLLWRTCQRSLFGGWELWLENWPKAGMAVCGIAYRRQRLVPRTYATECSSSLVGRPRLILGPDLNGGWWPTPRAIDNGQIKTTRKDKRCKTSAPTLSEAVMNWPGDGGHTGTLNPPWVEWLMGFPIGWTDLEDLETP